MDVYLFLLPAYITAAELVIIVTMFLVIRLNVSAGQFMTVLSLSVGIVTVLCLRFGIDFASKLYDFSRNFSTTPFEDVKRFTKYDRCMLASCRPLQLKVGETFKITRNTFPTISQDIILGSLVNLLLTF